MPEPSQPRARLVLLWFAGVALAAMTGVGGVFAAIGGTLAQPLFALAVAHARGRTRVGARPVPRDALALLLLWVIGIAAVAALVAWPLSALLRGGSLLAA